MQSFGDDTLSACLKTEVKNLDIFREDTDLEKYFKDSVLFSKISSKPGPTQSKYTALCVTTNSKNANENRSNIGESSKNNATVSRSRSKENKEPRSNTLNTRNKSLLKKNHDFYRISKKSINIKSSRTGQQSSTSVLSKQSYKSELSSINTENCDSKTGSSTLHSISEDKGNTKLSLSNASNNEQKSNEIKSYISIVPTQDRCKLNSWGLPENILQKYEARGVSNMFPWQVECLSNCRVIEERRNLVYSAPTSAGKTLVAEILLIKTVLETRKKVIFILPFVSVVREKMYYFQDLLSDSGIRVEGFMGGVVPAGGFAATHVAIATIEKANSLVNRLMEENELANLGAVVIDELHLVGDPNRGYLLELLLTKLKYMTLREENVNIQLIGMSATLPNLSLLAEWLNAELYKTEFRPVPLNEQCKIGTNIYDSKLELIRTLVPIPELTTDTDNVLQLCIETISDGHSVLIFCPTKNWCEKLAEQIASAIFKLGREDTQLGATLRQQLDATLISETLEQLKRSPTGLDSVLRNTVSFGIAFHHAGLTMDERDIIEGSFRSGSLRVLIATSTLSSGVNLPARRVIVRSPMFGGRVLDSLTYKQMIGRAGRMGKDTAGESILMCKLQERKAAESLLSATLQPIESCLEDSGPLIRALLEAIASEVVFTPSDLELYTKCTLVSLSDDDDSISPSKEAIKFLVDNEFLLLQQTEEEHRWVATALGKACLAASVPPKEALFLLEELQKARRCFVLDTELHVVYLVTPLNSGSQIPKIDWMTFLDLWRMLSESERRVGQLVGVEERFLTSAVKGIVRPGKLLSIHKRFYTALALHDLVREMPLYAVCKKYGCCRGILQSLQQSAATFAGMVTQFCKQLGWDCMELLVSQFQTRLQFGVCRELLDLLRLPMLNGLRARSLYKQGITTIAELAVANELDVERALYKALPFESEREQDGEHESEAVKRNKMRTVFVTGRDGLTPHEAAILLVQEARTLVQNELRLQDMSWKQNDQSSITNKSSVDTESHTRHTTFESTKCTDPKINNEITVDPDAQTEVYPDSNVQLEMQASEIPMDQNISPKNESRSLTNNKETTDLQSKTDAKSLECNLTREVTEEKKNDQTKSTNQPLTLNLPEFMDTRTEKYSIDFFDDSSPQMPNDSEKRRTSESLISFKSMSRSRTQIISDKNTGNNTEYMENMSDFPNKKLRTPNLEEAQTTNAFATNAIIHRAVLESSAKQRMSRSPSLFDDSFNIDTQICNVLEQNIMDFSEFEETKSMNQKVADDNVSKKASNTFCDTRKVQTDSILKSKSTSKICSSNFTNLQSKHSALSWKDDSWNETKGLLSKLNAINNKVSEETPKKRSIRNIKNTNISHILDAPGTSNSTPESKRKCDVKAGSSMHNSEDLKTITQKRRFKEIPPAKSPVANVIIFSQNRGTSVDSNKSESDDIIIPSQNMESPGSLKIRSILDSERRRKMYTQKISGPLSHSGKRDVKTLTETGEATPKLNSVLARKVLSSKDCSTDSVISNSDDDTPIKSIKSLQKSRLVLKKSQAISKICVEPPKIEDVNETTNWNTLNVIKVGSDRGTFSLFRRELMNKKYVALALHCEFYTNEVNNIGSKIISSTNTEGKRKPKKTESYVHGDVKLCGAAISWENNIAYYISFFNDPESKITGKEQMKLLKEMLSNASLYVKCFATKEVWKVLYQCCGISINAAFLDPKVASWLHDSNTYEKTYNEMVAEYFPQGCFISKRVGSCYDTGPGLNIKSSFPGELRASAESVLTWHLTDTLMNKLEDLNATLLYTFKEVEMKTVTLLACMELTGLGVSSKSLQDLSSVIRREMTSLEERAYALSGKKFNFSSSKEVGQVLGLYKGKKISVNKGVLEHTDHPISTLVISWRKLSATQSKIIFPLLNLAQHSPRIHGNCVTSTVTGRISMHEPNLQNVPKDFNSEDNSFVISVRMAFVPALGNVMLSADYCQLELRILAHFSKDLTLCDIMRKPGDIFRNIAAKWNHVSEEEVDDKMRQHTKQLCYGMIYGMGVKTLAESLSVDETKAKEFLEAFISTYPGIRKWLDQVLEEARTTGYVTTLLQRRRMLPGLNSAKLSEKSQAERQAINTKVQGSAADIAKQAMVNIEERMRYEFPNSSSIMPALHVKRKLRSSSREALPKGGYLVLQLHDELLYEVNANDLNQVAVIVKESMEQVCRLAVPLPVKIKVGPAWGDLTEYNFDH